MSNNNTPTEVPAEMIWHQRTSPDTIELLTTRRSLPNEYHREPGPTPGELDLLLRCATRVPDHAKLAPWRIHVVQGEARRKLGEELARIYAAKHPNAHERQLEAERNRPCRSPLLLVVSTRIESDRIPRWEQELSGGAVCQNIIIAANALGYAAQWLTDWIAYDDEVKAVLGVPPQDKFLGFLYIGTPAQAPQERPRPALADVVSYWE
jgi:nitroreductase